MFYKDDLMRVCIRRFIDVQQLKLFPLYLQRHKNKP